MVGYDREEVAKGDTKERLNAFLRWMEENGVHVQGCTLKPCGEDGEAGIGVFTTDSHPKDGILMATPLFLAITPMTALQDPLLGSVFAKLFEKEDVDDRLVIMLFLVVERHRGESSFWAPYLKMLPTKFGMTLCFTDEELLELKGTALYKATKIQQAGLRKHFLETVKGLAETILMSVGLLEREVEFEDFLWAYCIFWTRALNVPCPQSLVFSKALSTKSSSLHQKEQNIGNDTVSAPVLQLNNGLTEIADKEQHFTAECSAQSQQNGKRALGQSDNSEAQDIAVKFSTKAAIELRSVDNDSDVGIFSCTSSEMRTSEEPEPESTIMVEALVPGIDFCNHASKAAVLWEVDDEKGSASGVHYSMYLLTGIELPSGTEVRINYGNKGNEASTCIVIPPLKQAFFLSVKFLMVTFLCASLPMTKMACKYNED